MDENRKRLGNSQSEILDERQRRYLLVVGYLQQMALPSMFNRELTEEDYEMWKKFLEPYPLPSIEYAFDNWVRNGKLWPKPANILELIGVWGLAHSTDEFRPCGQCCEGWVLIGAGKTIGGESLKIGDRMVKRCQCFETWTARKKAA